MPSLRRNTKSRSTAEASEHQQLLALINSIGDGFVSLDTKGNITHFNSAALVILEKKDLGDQQFSQVAEVIDKNGYPVDLQKMVLLSDKTFVSREWRLRYGNGSAINLQVDSSPLRSGSSKISIRGYVLLLRDITDQKVLEDERDEFISIASHELRTPIAIAEGSLSNAQLLAEQTKTTDSVKHSLSAAHDQILLLSDLINDLSMLTMAEGVGRPQTIETFAARELVESLVQDYKPQAEQKRLKLLAEVKGSVGLLTSNRLYVREILQNFITNSIKYTEKGSITLKASAKDDGVEFKVTDTGVGISKGEQVKLFSKFFRSEDWRIRQNSGTGLGLYIVAKLASSIGGRLGMQSELDHGSSFKLYVPNLRIT
jgi:PAS domain S-box-containing protein